jgi:hypothetical protein
MPSQSLQQWLTVRTNELDEMENAHRSIGGIHRGRRYATRQVNHAYTVLLSSQFQGFCRDLHTECSGIIVASIQPPTLRPFMEEGFLRDRKLDKGNPNPGNIGSDYDRFAVTLWADLYALNPRNRERRVALEELNDWRNAISHQDFTRTGVSTIQLPKVRSWRAACSNLAYSMDTVLRLHLSRTLGTVPW